MRITYLIIIAIMFVGMMYQRDVISDQNDKLSAQSKTVAETTAKLIKADKERRDALCDVEYLRESNEALIRYSEPKSVLRAIKKTPLPKMKG